MVIVKDCVVCAFAPQNCICENIETIQKEEAPVEEEVEEVEEVEEEDFEAYLEALPVKELKKLCEKADLETKGKKADLIARLIE